MSIKSPSRSAYVSDAKDAEVLYLGSIGTAGPTLIGSSANAGYRAHPRVPGVEHRVTVTQNGRYDFEGRLYPSLSMIAREITGTRR
jgi:Protein of unknown function (DUF2924)